MPENRDLALAILDVVSAAYGVPRDEVLPIDVEWPERPHRLLADSDLWRPLKLELLHATLGPDVQTDSIEEDDVHALISSIASEDRSDELRAELPGVLSSNELDVAADPLGRTDLDDGPDILQLLHQDIRGTVVRRRQRCNAESVAVDGDPALSIALEAVSRRPVGEFYDLVNPRRWPECPLQGLFFRRMDPMPVSNMAVLANPPDRGWTETLVEVVDFSLGWGIPGFVFTTYLDFLFVDNDPSPSPLSTPTIGSTYDLVQSVDDRIGVDRGYLLAEQRSDGVTHMSTLKEIWFQDGNLPPGGICPVWSFFASILELACAGDAPGPRDPIIASGRTFGLSDWWRATGTAFDLAARLVAEGAACVESHDGSTDEAEPAPEPEAVAEPDAEQEEAGKAVVTAKTKTRPNLPRGVTPKTDGFRRIGSPTIVIVPERVTFDPDPVGPGEALDVEVELPPDPGPAIYEAIVFDRDRPKEPICDPVRFTTPTVR